MVAIKDMEMPRSCFCCLFAKSDRIDSGYYCTLQKLGDTGGYYKGKFKAYGKWHDKENCPLIEIKQSDDCVSRQAVLDTLMKYEKPCDDRQDFYLDSTTEFEEEIKKLPPITQ